MFTPKSSYNKDELIACSNGELFTKEGDGRLPSDLMLMFDEITNIDDFSGNFNKGAIEAVLNINPDLWFFKYHFKEDPVMPGCLGLDAMWQLVGFFLGWSGAEGRGRALGAGNVKFSGQVTPKNKLVTYRIEMRRVMLRKLVMGVADGTMLVDGKEIYTAEDLRVGLFKSTEEF